MVTQTLEILYGLAVVVLYVKRNSINALERLARIVLKTHIFPVFALQRQEMSKTRMICGKRPLDWMTMASFSHNHKFEYCLDGGNVRAR